MNTITINDIRGFGPCYDPSRYLPEDWTGTALDVLGVLDCPAADRIWVVRGMMSNNDRRRAACAFVRRTPVGGGKTVWDLLADERSRKAVEVAERFANGSATERELDEAWDAAWDAARDARDAWDAARDAARAVAGDVAGLAAWAAAGDAARDAALDAQIEHLREMLTTYE